MSVSESFVVLFAKKNLLLVPHEGAAGAAAAIETVVCIVTLDAVKGTDRGLKAGKKTAIDCDKSAGALCQTTTVLTWAAQDA